MTAAYRFGNAELRPEQRKLLMGGKDSRIGACAFDLLLTLVERRDRVVTKNELLDAVWPGLVVEESNLQVHISSLRKVLGPEVIVTIPGRGYRFTGALDGPAAGQSNATVPGPTPTHARSDALAEPLTNLPAELPSLYGRTEDLPALRSLIESHKLVTVVGAGGIGKTALAQALAHILRASFDDGVWLVELAPIADSSLIAPTVAGVLQVTLGVEEELLQLAIALDDKRMALSALTYLERSAAALGRLEESVARGRDLALRMRHERFLRSGIENIVLTNLRMSLTQVGEIDEALEVARSAYPWSNRRVVCWIYWTPTHSSHSNAGASAMRLACWGVPTCAMRQETSTGKKSNRSSETSSCSACERPCRPMNYPA